MPGFSWKKAKTLLTETEKDRLCCLILTCADQIKVISSPSLTQYITLNLM
jgi:hypothetical protein